MLSKWFRPVAARCKRAALNNLNVNNRVKLRLYIPILLLIGCGINVFAQQPILELSPEHLRKIERIKDGRKKLREYKKFYSKDSTKYVKALKKYWKRKSDSLYQHSVLAQKKNELQKKYEGKTPRVSKDSLSVDSLKTVVYEQGKEVLNNQKEVGGVKEKIEPLTSQISEGKEALTFTNNPDSLKTYAKSYAQQQANNLESKVEGLDQVQELKKQQSEWMELQSAPEQYKSQIEDYSDKARLKEEVKALARQQVTEVFAKNGKALKAAQKKLSRLQNKYSSILSTDDMSTAIKRSSLKGKPLKQRLFIGGNFNVNHLQPLSFDFSPQIGYKFNRRFIVGIGGIMRHTFGDTIDVKPSVPVNSYGYKSFMSYDVIKSFFAYGEFERASTEEQLPNSDQMKTTWQSGLLIGAGRKMKVHPKLDMNVMVLYNFLHDPESAIYPRPWIIKFGFNVSELGLLKKR